jgi:hypothetical protein
MEIITYRVNLTTNNEGKTHETQIGKPTMEENI